MSKSYTSNTRSRPIASAAKAVCGSSAGAMDNTDMIRNVARKLFEKKGSQPGHDLENWLEAEKLVRSGKI